MLNFRKRQVTVWGLGLHGGGVASCQFCASRGAKVTVLDSKPAEALAPSIEKLRQYDITFLLGEERPDVIRSADFVIKNPAIPRSHPLLTQARWVETDLSLFFREAQPSIIAVTGTKGKSTTAALIYHVLSQCRPSVAIAGNSTNSPLSLLPHPPETLILEISSFQLGDLQYVFTQKGHSFLPPAPCPHPEIAVLTNLYPDHLNYYPTMIEYAEDKKLLFRWQNSGQRRIVHHSFRQLVPDRRGISAWFSSSPLDGSEAWIENRQVHFRSTKGVHHLPAEGYLAKGFTPQLLSAAAASLVLRDYQVAAETIEHLIPGFPGLPHRLEYLGTQNEVSFYNDSASTIPESTLASISSFIESVHLIAGGTDKNLDFSPFTKIAKEASSLHLLQGSATTQIIRLLEKHSLSYAGPFSNLDEALNRALQLTRPKDIILFSPGSASFELYKNEFLRGAHFQTLVRNLTEEAPL